MWTGDWQDKIWSNIEGPWDILIVGGGITGAGILREAARVGLRALLVEADDFASGTSSRSSKLVHGGLRYLKNAQIGLVRQSVRERERLLKEANGLVTPLGFLLANYEGDSMPDWAFGAGLVLYDLLALKWGHRHYDAYDMGQFYQALDKEGLLGGYRYFDAQTDDARLVLRVLQEAVRDGGMALNYTRASSLLRLRTGRVGGVVLEDVSFNGNRRSAEVKAKVVVNATGAWADELRMQLGKRKRLRRLRGSHLVFPAERFPLSRSISFMHPIDGRPVFAFPWEGATLLGTTDVDYREKMRTDPSISEAEVNYLLGSVQTRFPALELSEADVLSTFAGIRPVLDTGKEDPSDESREQILWSERGLLTITGGKLTTFRLMAHAALRKIRLRLPGWPRFDEDKRVLSEPPGEDEMPANMAAERLSPLSRLRLSGRYGAGAAGLIAAAQPGELNNIAGTPSLWAELRWAARCEGVEHLDDLLLRRTRIGLLIPGGGEPCLEHIRQIVQPELGWEDERWEFEVHNYQELWRNSYHIK